MSELSRAWTPRRHHAAGVTSLEVWNLPVFGRELWELLGAPRVEADRRAGVPEAQLAEQLFPALMSALEQLVHRHAVDAVWLSGGLACLEGFEVGAAKATAALGCPVYVSKAPRFAPVYAGLGLVTARTPLVLDVGQTSIKCASPGAQRVFERDLNELPRLFIGMPRPVDGHHIVAAVRFIANALRTCARDLKVEGMCLALPCPLDEALVPGGCTYGWEGHASLVADILEEAALPGGGEVLVLNDAELAAEAARMELRKHKHRHILCLTLGFGPGGALLTTSTSPSK
ncbi:ROK family protein [Myxococcus qinghaiensis]|uniref:ROK family protein n=1 Tax=Myxococcus qinghaiensis TaxID=2906758 RepID=UPI0020A75C2E|nr:ROK family protein [Myxococcus qinghaiensis]MCP3163205.1 ROK family protein [Myxococcus qinghaiensis]